jgi:hypothetical protein
MKLVNALLAQAKKKHSQELLNILGNSIVYIPTVYKNKQGRTFFKKVRTVYVVRNGYKSLYGRKAHSPKNLLKQAPRAIRPRR